MSTSLDPVDLALLRCLRTEPRASLAAISRRIGVARGTVYARLARLEETGVIVDHAPSVDAAAAGFAVMAFTTLEIAQGSHTETVAALETIDEVIEIHTVTGPGDLVCRIIARSNGHLHDLLQRIASLPTVRRSTSQLALASRHPRSVLDVVVAD